MSMANENGVAGPSMIRIGTSWLREVGADGRKRFHVYAIIQGPPAYVVGEATLEAPNLEVAAILLNGIRETLAKQPPEIISPNGKVNG